MLVLKDGEIVTSQRVVVAAGITHFDHVPEELAPLRGSLVSHSADHHELAGFAKKQVLVVGGGASGIELAQLLHEQGASVTVAARAPHISWCDPRRARTLMDKIREPVSGLGTGWRSVACVAGPMVFYGMPQDFRVMVARWHLGPARG